MSQRLNYFQVSNKAMEPLIASEKYIASCYKTKKSLSAELVELIKIRVSQINRCAYCIEMHTKDALAIGISSQKIFSLDAWEDSPFF